jgi:histidinol-phosphate aminotransferase
MSLTLKFHEYLNALTPYQTASKLECEGKVIRLCFNEGAFGPNPKAIAAVQKATESMHIYPDAGYTRLRAGLAEKFRLDASRIVCGAGSDDLINVLVRAFATEGDEVVTNAYGFSMYPIAAKAVGAKPVMVPEKEMVADLDAMLAAITPRTRLVFLANPNNPTGSSLSREALNHFIARLPPHVLFVYDAAYADYMTDPEYTDGFEWVKGDGQVCVLRTFSKIHGLGGLRVGWAYGPDNVVAALNRVRNPFNVASLGEAAALTSLQDDDFIDHCRAHTLLWRDKLHAELLGLGLKPYPSKCNFILTRFASAEEADQVFRYLKEHKILLRPMAGYGLADCLRITVGKEHEMNALFTALHNYEGFKNGKNQNRGKSESQSAAKTGSSAA